jgi:hypothetical protein
MLDIDGFLASTGFLTQIASIIAAIFSAIFGGLINGLFAVG